MSKKFHDKLESEGYEFLGNKQVGGIKVVINHCGEELITREVSIDYIFDDELIEEFLEIGLYTDIKVVDAYTRHGDKLEDFRAIYGKK